MADFKNTLYIWCSKSGRTLRYTYKPLERSSFLCEAVIDGIDYVAIGKASNKKDAQAQAAQDFLRYLTENKMNDLPGNDSLANGETDTVMNDAHVNVPDKAHSINPEELHKQQKLEEMHWNNDAHTHGNWTLNVAKFRLHKYLQINKIKTEYVYTYFGKLTDKPFAAEMKVYLKDKNTTLTANERGFSKLFASKATALNLVRQLYHMGLIETFKGIPDKDNIEMDPYHISLDPKIEKDLKNALDLLQAPIISLLKDEIKNNLGTSYQAHELLPDSCYNTEDISLAPETNLKSIVWCPPTLNYDPWRHCEIGDNQQLKDALTNDRERKEKIEMYPIMKKVLEERELLPIYKHKKDILETIEKNTVTVIKGIPGSGKSTQVPQYVLDEFVEKDKGFECNVLSVQPNRFNCLALWERVSEERLESSGASATSVGATGYAATNFETKLPRSHGSILFSSSEYTVARLSDGLKGISHVILDEVQERDINMEFLVIFLRDLCVLNPNLKLILMVSATDVDYIVNYFPGSATVDIPPLKTFSPQRYYLEDCVQMTNFDFDGSVSSTLSKIRKKRKLKKGKKKERPSSATPITLDTKTITAVVDTTAVKDPTTITATDDTATAVENDTAVIVEENCTAEESTAVKGDENKTCTLTNGDSINGGVVHEGGDKADKIIPEPADHELNINLNVCISNVYKPETRAACSKIQEKEICFELIHALLDYIEHLQNPGGILIFLPSIHDIQQLYKYFKDIPKYNDDAYRILQLHDYTPISEFRKLFQSTPVNVTKVVLSTDIAENGVTLNDIVYVIDACKYSTKIYNTKHDSEMTGTRFASKFNLDSRLQRAGHVRPGFCFHLCSRSRYERLDDYPSPEMHSSALHGILLTIKSLDLTPNIGSFLVKAVEPPPIENVRACLISLFRMGALESTDAPSTTEEFSEVTNAKLALGIAVVPKLTSVGKFLVKIAGLDPKLGKMLLLGTILGLGDSVAIVAALASSPDIFSFDLHRKHLNPKYRKFYGNRYGDYVARFTAFQAWQLAKTEGNEIHFCHENGLSSDALNLVNDAYGNLKGTLKAFGFANECLCPNKLNTLFTDSRLDMIIGLLCIGFNPNFAYNESKRSVLVNDSQPALIAKNSVLCSSNLSLPCPFLVYDNLISGRSLKISNVSMMSPLHLLLLGTYDFVVKDKFVLINDWLKFEMDSEILSELMALRKLTDDLLNFICDKPSFLLDELLVYKSAPQSRATKNKTDNSTEIHPAVRAALIIDELYTLCDFDAARYEMPSITQATPSTIELPVSVPPKEKMPNNVDHSTVQDNDKPGEETSSIQNGPSTSTSKSILEEDEEYKRTIDVDYVENADQDDVESLLSFQSGDSFHVPLAKLIRFKHSVHTDHHSVEFRPGRECTFLPTNMGSILKNIESGVGPAALASGVVGSEDFIDPDLYDVNTFTNDHVDLSFQPAARFGAGGRNKDRWFGPQGGGHAGVRNHMQQYRGGGPFPSPMMSRFGGMANALFGRPAARMHHPGGFLAPSRFRPIYGGMVNPPNYFNQMLSASLLASRGGDGGPPRNMAYGSGNRSGGGGMGNSSKSKKRKRVTSVSTANNQGAVTSPGSVASNAPPSAQSNAPGVSMPLKIPGVALPFNLNSGKLTSNDVKGIRTDTLDPKVREIIVKARKKAKRERYLQNKRDQETGGSAGKPSVGASNQKPIGTVKKNVSNNRRYFSTAKTSQAANALAPYSQLKNTLVGGGGGGAKGPTPGTGAGKVVISKMGGGKFTPSSSLNKPKVAAAYAVPSGQNKSTLQDSYSSYFKFGELLANKNAPTASTLPATQLNATVASQQQQQQQYYTGYPNYGYGVGVGSTLNEQTMYAAMGNLYESMFGTQQAAYQQPNPQAYGAMAGTNYGAAPAYQQYNMAPTMLPQVGLGSTSTATAVVPQTPTLYNPYSACYPNLPY